MKSSAYLSIFDDWDILPIALRTIYDRVDEIVVVDGAYRWMAPFFATEGRDASTSVPQVHDALAPFSAKLRIVNGLWQNEMEKRRAGYEACSHRYIYRVDADEVLFFDEDAVAKFFASGCAVAAMGMPIYIAPGWIRARHANSDVERQALLFDRDQIDARRHLDYLWLVMPPAEERERSPADLARILPFPIAFNAHLSHWRTPRSSISRARFYILNYVRQERQLGWAPGFRYDERVGFEGLFRYIAPRQFTELLYGNDIVVGPIDLGGLGIYPTPLTPEQEGVFAHLHTELLYSLMRLNRQLASQPRAVCGQVSLDISTPAARRALGDGRRIMLAFSEPLHRLDAQVVWMTHEPPFHIVEKLVPELDGSRAVITLPEEIPASLLLATVQIVPVGTSGASVLTCRAERQAMPVA